MFKYIVPLVTGLALFMAVPKPASADTSPTIENPFNEPDGGQMVRGLDGGRPGDGVAGDGEG